MTDRVYDTRSRPAILAAEHFAPFRETPGIGDIDMRELRTLDRFFRFAEKQGITVPGVADFLSFVTADTSTRRLNDLRATFDRLLPEGAPVREVVREAIRAKCPRSRSCDRRDRAALRAHPLMAPYRGLPGFERVALEDLRVLARFLVFTEARGIHVPTEADYLAFATDTVSSRRLRSLKAALDALMPGNPAVHVVLAGAIRRKSPAKPSRAGQVPRPPAARRVEAAELPESWRSLLQRMRLGAMPLDQAVPAASVIDSMEDVLREYAHVQRGAGTEVAITIEGVRRFEASRAAHAAARENPTYQAQGNRPATRHTAVMRLRKFGETLGLEPLVISALHHHETCLRRELGSVVPLKFGRFENLPNLAVTWGLAADLLAQSAVAPRRQTKLRLLTEASVVAIWTLLPLRLGDGQLLWGRDIRFDGARYRVEVETRKEEEPLRGALHKVLTPFLDALVLQGMDPVWLLQMRERAMAEELPLFRAINGRQLVASYPSGVWRQHFGTGAHIARTRVHSELGQLGTEGVEAALALNAQRSLRISTDYQSDAVDHALRRQAQGMVDGLLAECWET